MAKLSPDQAREIFKSPKNRGYINQAILQQDRLLFHCEPVQEKLHLSNAYRYFKSWVSGIIPAEKVKKFVALLNTPVETVQSTKTIFNELSKVYHADNKVIKFDFVSDELEADASAYAAKIGDNDFWKTEGFKALKTGINDLIVVDLPSMQVTERPEPYYYLLGIKQVLDLSFFDDGKVDYVSFYRGRDDKYIYIDEASYMIFTKDADSGEYILNAQSIHSTYTENGILIDGLGYAPVRSYYDNPILNSNRVNKNGPLTSALSKLDWILFWRMSKKYFELYATWPIMVQYKRSCKYQDKEGNECREGFVNYQTPILTPEGLDSGSFDFHQRECPVCSSQSILGPGTKWEVDPPRDKDDVDLMLNPVKFIEVTGDKLEFCVSELERLENETYLDVVGWDGDAITKEAVNEEQVRAGVVSKEAVLDDIKGYGQKAQKFSMDTVFILRYGNKYFAGSTVDWGTNYFLKSKEQLLKEYSDAKNSGLPSFMLAEIRDKISRNENKNNPERLERNHILENLEPYLDYKISELVTLQIPTIDPDGYILKLNFNNFVQRFEREQMNIVQFGSLLQFDTKISIILDTLKSYGKEQKNSIPRVDTRTT